MWFRVVSVLSGLDFGLDFRINSGINFGAQFGMCR